MGIIKKDNIINLTVATFCTVVLAVIVGYTYSFFQVQESNSTVIAGEAESMSMSLEVKKVSLGNGKLIPQMGEYILSAVQGRNGSCVDDNNNTVCQVYRITLQNKGSSSIMVNGTVELDNKNNPNLKWTTISDFTEGEKPASSGVSRTADNTVLTTNEEYTAGQTKNYYIVVWVNETGLSQTDTGLFNGVVNFRNSDGSSGTAPKWNTTTPIDSSNANIPAYVDGLVPVMYDATTSNWVVADTTTTSTYGWYDYDTKKWANAVLVTNDKRASLTTNADGTYTAGQAIGDTEAEGVLAFYVWIPRYKYKVWNINKIADQSVYTYDAYTNGIDIEFEEGTSSTGGISCNYSFAAPVATAGSPNEVCTDKTGEGYYTHPAFTFGEDQLTGFWMGKFEISNIEQDDPYGGENSITLAPRTLPNVISWRNNPVSNFWLVINNMQASNNIYGLSTDRTNTDSHMLTNMEWGAVAYLTHSEYGRCENGTCTEVAINNSGEDSDYTNYTGRSSGVGGSSDYTEQGTYTYEEANGQLASTTGNIYGVYDMSGGAYEYVMGNIGKQAGQNSGKYEYYPSYAGSNYTYTGNEKYVTTYAYGTTYNNQQAYNRAKLGDATSEVLLTASTSGGWYGDYAYFPNSSNSWFLRGGGFDRGTLAGVFYFGRNNGNSTSDDSARAVLAGFAR